MSTRKDQARQIKLERLEQLDNILLTLKYTLQVRTSSESKCRDKDEKRRIFIQLSGANFRLSLTLIFYTDLFQRFSLFFVILDIVLRFFLGETINLISPSVNVTPTTEVLAYFFSSVKRNSIYPEINIAKLSTDS